MVVFAPIQEIDGPALLLVDMDTMRNLLNMKIGPALKVDDILSRLKRGHLWLKNTLIMMYTYYDIVNRNQPLGTS